MRKAAADHDSSGIMINVETVKADKAKFCTHALDFIQKMRKVDTNTIL